jgi:hypothetical protein
MFQETQVPVARTSITLRTNQGEDAVQETKQKWYCTLKKTKLPLRSSRLAIVQASFF